MPKVAFNTLGCKVNHYESEAMMDLFKERGYRVVDFREKADIYVIHSCTVTNQAASKSRNYARRAKRRNPEAKVVMVGCYAQASPEEVSEVEEVDYVLGTEGKENIVDLIEEPPEEKPLQEIRDFTELDTYEDIRIYELRETTRAYVKIEEGCDQFCSYCIIPYARGPVRSRGVQSIISEVKDLLAGNVKEIVLTGIHLGAFGKDRGQETALEELLEKLLTLNGNFRIRLSSIEVTEVSEYLLDLMAGSEQICNHLHLPLQSGSDRILTKMNRPYSAGEFENVVNRIRNRIPEIAITTDVIVGFPGETEEDFNNSFQLIRDLGFSRLHVFPFSRREGTPAARMKQVHGDIVKERSQQLRDLNEELMLAYQQQFFGDQRKVVIEEKRDHETGLLTGFTDNYIKVLVEGKDEIMGELIEVELTDSYNHETALGKLVK